jgi:serine/threonine protein kinase
MPAVKQRQAKLTAFNLKPGTLLTDKYEIMEKLGSGWEGEVYLVREKAANIERTAKLFFPQRNIRNKNIRFYAKKLHKLRHCPIVTQYHTQDSFLFRGLPIHFLVSEFVQGERLTQFINRQRGRRLGPYQATRMLYDLTVGIECIHRTNDYHGDLHSDNVMVQGCGIHFDLKLLDMFHWGPPRAENLQADITDLIRLYYDALGGQKHYRSQPQPVKDICCGLKRSLILKKFRTASKLRSHLERLRW